MNMPGPAPSNRAARDAAIVRDRAAGDTLSEIAARFGLSRERVRQVLAADGVVDRRGSRSARAARDRSAAERRRKEILEAWKTGDDPAAIAARLGLRRACVDALLHAHVRPADRLARRRSLAAVAPNGAARGHTDEELLRAVRQAVEEARGVPTGERYSKIARARGLPSVSTLANRFGGWNAAVRAAGFEPASDGRRDYRRRWTEQTCLEALRRVSAERGGMPSLREYEEISHGRPDLPSAATVRQRLGSWLILIARLDAEADLGSEGEFR